MDSLFGTRQTLAVRANGLCRLHMLAIFDLFRLCRLPILVVYNLFRLCRLHILVVYNLFPTFDSVDSWLKRLPMFHLLTKARSRPSGLNPA